MTYRILQISPILILLASILFPGCTNQPENQVISQQAPPFTLTSLEGESVSLEEKKGSTIVIHFGTSWCPFCRAEDPHLQNLYEEYKEKGVEVFVINVGENTEVAQRWKDEAGFTFPMFMDRDGAVSARYAPADAQPDLPRHEVMIASNLVIDSDGHIQYFSLLDTNAFDAKLVDLKKTLESVLNR